MHSGTIYWNSFDLRTIGRPKITIRRQPDPPAPSVATRQLVSLGITVELEALQPDTVLARLRHLQTTMQVTEGIIRVVNASGATAATWMARPSGDSLAEAIISPQGKVELSFSCVENHGEGGALVDSPHAIFHPTVTGTPMTLLAVRNFKESIRTDRHTERAHARRITQDTITFVARVAQANPTDAPAARLAYLQAQAEAVQSIYLSHGRLVFGTWDQVVRITECTPVIDETACSVDVSVQAYNLTMPDSATAEVMFDTASKMDEGTGELAITISGPIEAETKEIALTKFQSIRAAQCAITGRRLTNQLLTIRTIDGFDTADIAGADWTGTLTFSLEFRELRTGLHYTLKADTKTDLRSGCRFSYSGSLRADTADHALTAARALAGTREHPIRVSSSEMLEFVTGIDNLPSPGITVENFVKCDFSYEYEGPSNGFISAEIATDNPTPRFGEWKRSISGFVIAVTKDAAETFAASLVDGQGLALESSKRWSEVILDPDGSGEAVRRVAMKLDFTFVARQARGYSSVKYTDANQVSYASMTNSRTISGTIWADTEANANLCLIQLVTATLGSGATAQQMSTTSHKERDGEGATSPANLAGTAAHSAWVQLDFSFGSVLPVTGTVGFDIIEASYSIERTGSISLPVISPIPYDRPVVQADTGYTAGTVTITASCKARNQSTAKTWVQGKRSLVDSMGDSYETSAPRETLTPEFAPFDGTSAIFFRFNASYGWTITELDGLM